MKTVRKLGQLYIENMHVHVVVAVVVVVIAFGPVNGTVKILTTFSLSLFYGSTWARGRVPPSLGS